MYFPEQLYMIYMRLALFTKTFDFITQIDYITTTINEEILQVVNKITVDLSYN